MKKKAIILIGILVISSIFMASAGANYSQTITKYPCEGGPWLANDTMFEFIQTPRPGGEGTLTISVRGDYDYYDDDYSEQIEVMVEGTSLGTWLPGEQCSTNLLTKTFTVTKQQLIDWAADGKIEVTLVQGAEGELSYQNDVNCYVCGSTINIVTLEYPTGTSSLPMDWIMKKFGLGKED